MIKSLLIALLYSQIHSLLKSEVFPNCSSILFPNGVPIQTTTIDFSMACIILQPCSESFNLTKKVCLEKFSSYLEAACTSIADYNRRIKRFCEKKVSEKMKLARKLEDSKFKSYSNAFKGMIRVFGSENCFFSNSERLAVNSCNSSDNRMIFSFVQLSNGNFVIYHSEGKCVNNFMELNECNYNDNDFWFTMELSDLRNNQVNFLNIGSFQNIVISVISGIKDEKITA